MPTPSKFRHETRERVLQVLRAGGSRREAARSAGINHSQLTRWVQRGAKGAPGGRWATFRRQVLEAEGTPPALIALQDRFDRMDAADAWKFLLESEPGFGLPDPPEPVEVMVSFSPFTAPTGKDRA